MPKTSAGMSAPARWSVLTDLGFWMIASVIVAAFHAPLARAWGAPRFALLGLCLVVFVAGTVGLVPLRRLRRLPSRLIRAFGLANLATALVLLAAASLDWLHLTAAGNTALAAAAGIALLLGAWQLLSASLQPQG
jgi:hypothetical protein